MRQSLESPRDRIGHGLVGDCWIWHDQLAHHAILHIVLRSEHVCNYSWILDRGPRSWHRICVCSKSSAQEWFCRTDSHCSQMEHYKFKNDLASAAKDVFEPKFQWINTNCIIEKLGDITASMVMTRNSTRELFSDTLRAEGLHDIYVEVIEAAQTVFESAYDSAYVVPVCLGGALLCMGVFAANLDGTSRELRRVDDRAQHYHYRRSRNEQEDS